MISKKSFKICEKDLFIYDNVFSSQEIYDIYAIISQLSFVRANSDISFNVAEHRKKWICNIGSHDLLYQATLEKYSKNIDAIDWQNISNVKQYINYSTPETVDELHNDSNFLQPKSYTMLQYTNYIWDVNWHGETIFYEDDSSDAVFTSIVKPGRVIVFDSAIRHSATAPSTLANFPRFTLATKILLN